MKQTHYFIAIPVAGEAGERLARWRMEAEYAFPFRSWVHRQDYHITLAFLGAASFAQLEEVKREMEQIAKRHASFPLLLADLHTFGNRAAPRILWMGVKEEEKLSTLRQDVYDACVSLGFSLDKRPFTPHITVARKWQGEGEFPIEKMKEIFKDKGENITFLADEIVLYQTHLERVPKYEPLSTFPLLS